MIASVIINVSSSNVDQQYDYIVPENLCSMICVGGRVKVKFGKADRTVMGFVIDLRDDSAYNGNLKEIVEVVDIESIISQEQFLLAKYIQFDTMSPMVRILNMMIPEALQLKTVKYLTVLDYSSMDADLALVFSGKQIIEYTPALYKYHNKIKNEIEKKHIELNYDAVTSTNIKTVDKYCLDLDVYFRKGAYLSEHINDTLKRMIDEMPLTINEIADNYDLSIYMVRSLIKRCYFKKIVQKVSRIKEKEIPVFTRYKDSELLSIKDTITKLESNLNIPHLWIPQGNQEMTLGLFSLVYNTIEKKQNVLVIVPDILASYKFSSILRKMTHLNVACLNSGISKGEDLDYYQEIKDNKYQIIVTTPGDSLYPFHNLGLILMLNAENDNYFNDQSPRYDLKKVMIEKSKIEKVNFIMHSYSPTIIEYCRGLQNNYQMIDNRITNKNNNVEIVDLTKELSLGNDSYISSRLIKKMKITKAEGKQTVLIINNKNYSSAVICRSCGFIHKCPRCELTLKYSKKNNMLTCPACSYRIAYESDCPRCGSKSLRLNGVGIESLEENLKELVPMLKVITIDSPSIDNFQEKIIEVEEQKIDVIITTDTFARSIYHKHIGLVGIINIDSIAYSSNYNANERAYNLLINTTSLLEDNIEGLLMIQTYHPDNTMLSDFITGDYKEYLRKEISNRKILKNEPFYFINRILVKAKYEEMFVEADLVKKILKEMFKDKIFIIGPIYNRTEMAAQIIVKHRIEDISTYYQKIYEQYQNSDIKIIFDKYPKYL